jgi:hypothetical protein
MSRNIQGVIVICEEDPDTCEMCGRFEELRPYGPKGEKVCFDCAMKDPKGTEERMRKILFHEKPIQ